YDYSADGQVRTNTLADGSWQIEFYDSNGRVTNLFAAFRDQTPTTDKTLCRFVEYLYPTGPHGFPFLDPGTFKTNVPRQVTEYLTNQLVARTTNNIYPNGTYLKHEQRVYTTLTDYLTTVTVEHLGDAWDGLPQSVTFPDSLAAVYEYSLNRQSNSFAFGLSDGNFPPNVVTNDRFKATTVTGPLGEPLSSTVIDLRSRQTNALELYSEHDGYGRPRKVRFLDGTSDSIVYGCCGPEIVTNRESIVTALTYDGLKRPLTADVNGLLYTSIYDGAANLLSRTRRGTDATTITMGSFGYDWAGRLTNAIDAVNRKTRVSETAPPITRTITYEDISTRVEDYYRDGTLKRVTGAATFPVRYEYGATNNQTFRREIRLATNGTDTAEWTMTLYDMAGRAVKLIESAPPGPPNPVHQRAFNSQGRLSYVIDPDGYTLRYSYIDNGDINFLGLDVNTNGTFDFGGPDRILSFFYSDTTVEGVPVRRTEVRHDMPSGGPVTLGVRDVSYNGLRAWTTAFGQTNKTQLLFTNGNRYVIRTAPDGTAAVSTYNTGRLASVQVTNAALGSLRSFTFGYDTHGRPNRLTDARTGTTTNTFYDDDRVLATYTPAPGPGQASIGRSFTYDSRGRLQFTYLPGGGSILTQFYPTGLPFSRSG